MARPVRINYPGAFYHITCRGNERKNIFADDLDRSLFLDNLKTSIGIYQVRGEPKGTLLTSWNNSVTEKIPSLSLSSASICLRNSPPVPVSRRARHRGRHGKGSGVIFAIFARA
jgi:hypothetical protein